jgi:5'-phosphate synthase pdxT subunit
VPPVGVLALQGDWEAHRRILLGLGAEVRTVRTAADLEAVGALVIPGGESSAMLRLMESEDLFHRLRQRVAAGMAVLGTCAGVILLAEAIEPPQPSIGGLSVTAVRNAYGRQLDSMVAEVELTPELGPPLSVEGVFIRAPRISRTGPEVEVLGRWKGDPVLVRQGLVLGATYHPELGADTRVHEMFLRMREDGHG